MRKALKSVSNQLSGNFQKVTLLPSRVYLPQVLQKSYHSLDFQAAFMRLETYDEKTFSRKNGNSKSVFVVLLLFFDMCRVMALLAERRFEYNLYKNYPLLYQNFIQ